MTAAMRCQCSDQKRSGQNKSTIIKLRQSQAGGAGCSAELDGGLGGAADFDEALAVALHVGVLLEPGAEFPEDAGGVWVCGFDEAVVHPLAFAAGGDDACAAQVCEVARNLRLVGVEYGDEEADADLVVAHQVDEPQPRPVGQRTEEQ